MTGISNARWIAVSQVGRIAIQLVGLSLLARLIPPNEYGIMAMATVATNFALIIRDVGTSAAIIQKKTLTEETINAVFWLNILAGLVIAIALIAFSIPISDCFHTSALRAILCALAFVFPLTSSASVHLALLERNSVFKTVARIEISAALIGLIVAVVAALLGAGVYSLVLQSLVNAAISSIQLWIASSWSPRKPSRADWKDLKSLLGYSGNLSGFNLINYFSRNADSIIIGHYLTSAVLGAYSLAYRLMLFPLQSLTFVSSRALFPILSKHQDDQAAFWNRYTRTIGVIASITAPLMTGLLLLRKPFVDLVFGPNWGLTADLLFWLAPTGFIQSIISTTGTVFMAKGRTDLLMRLGILGAILQVGAFLLGVKYDVLTMTKFYLIANILNAGPTLYLVSKLLDGKLYKFAQILMPIAISTAIMALALLGFLSGSEQLGISNRLIVVSGGSLIGVLVYAAVLAATARSQFQEILSIFLRRKKTVS